MKSNLTLVNLPYSSSNDQLCEYGNSSCVNNSPNEKVDSTIRSTPGTTPTSSPELRLSDSDSFKEEGGHPLLHMDSRMSGTSSIRRTPSAVFRGSPPPCRDVYYDVTSLPTVTPAPILGESQRVAKVQAICNGTHCKIQRGEFCGRTVALKTLADRSLFSIIGRQEFVDEIKFLSRISHPHIVTLFHHYEEAVTDAVSKPVMVLEILEGNTLRHHLNIKRSFHAKAFSKLRYIRIARELASALDYLHNRFSPDCVLIHRDLKPDNIGFTADGTLKVFDFGLCVAVPRANKSSLKTTYSMTGQTGSPRYMAPEVALNKDYNESVDVYSYSIILHEIITGIASFRGLTQEQFHEQVVRGMKRPGLDFDEYGRALHLHPRLRDLLASAWSNQLTERPTADQLLAIVTEVEREFQVRYDRKPYLMKAYKQLFSRKDTI